MKFNLTHDPTTLEINRDEYNGHLTYIQTSTHLGSTILFFEI